jgi:hypothetical protein
MRELQDVVSEYVKVAVDGKGEQTFEGPYR